MLTRLARGRLRAACAAGLLTWLTAYGLTLPLRAQGIVGAQGDAGWQTQDELAPGGRDEFDDLGYGSDCGGTCGCGDACCDTCCDGSHMQDCDWFCCGPYTGGQHWWFGGELLLWRVSGTHLPALVTDSPAALPPTLNLSTTNVLAGGDVTGNSWRSGYRLELGVWFDDCQELALIGDYFNAGENDYDYFFPGSSGRNTGRPYFDTENGIASVRLISVPGELDGTIAITADDDFQSAGLAIQQRVYAVGDTSGYGTSTQVMVLGGYRFFSYDSQLSIRDHRVDTNGAGMGDQDFRRDMFTTDNEFHGGEIGVMTRFTQTGCWFDGLFKLAIGGHKKRATVNGAAATIPNGMPVEFEDGGLLTSSLTNIGTYTDSRVRIIPTFRFGFGAYLTPQWTFQAGYTAVAWSGVARAGGLTPPNLAVDPRNVPPVMAGGGTAPVFQGLGGSKLVAHGLDLGIEYRY
jgi:hypothetical protein